MINLLTKGKVPSLVLFIFLLALMPLKSLAAFTQGNLTYTPTGGTASVKAANTSITGEVSIPDTVIYNGSPIAVNRMLAGAFGGCSKLTVLNIPHTFTLIAENCFYNTPALTAINVDSLNTAFCSDGGVLFDKNKTLIIRYPQAKEGLSYTIASTVKTVGPYAFNGSNLNSILINKSVTSIGAAAFAKCSNLVVLICLATTPPSINSDTFSNTPEGKTLYVPAEAVDAYKASDWNNYFTTIMAFPSEFTVGDLTYTNLTEENTVTVKAADTSISGEITIPETVTIFGITYTVTKIALDGFSRCNGMTVLNIPKTITNWASNSFSYLRAITAINVDNENTKMSSQDGILFDKAKTVLYLYPACKSGDSYTIPSTVTRIAGRAIYAAKSLTSVVITENVTTIEGFVFQGCSNLVELTCLATTPPSITKYTFDDMPADKILYVPAGTLEAYKASDWNKYFTNIQEIINPLVINIIGEGKVYNDNVAVASGSVIDEGSVNLLILPDDGYYIESATLAGVDVKDRIVNHFLSIEDCSNAGVLEVFFAENEEEGEPEEASLTVNGGDTHSLAHYYTEGTQAKINLKPNTGWELYSLAYNGDDVTNEVDNNTYTTPELYGHDNNLDIVMKKSQTTGANAAYAQRRISFRSFGEIVEIFNLEDGENISIYDLEGNCKYQGSNHTVSLTPGNVYILNTNNETLKFSH